MDLTADQVDLIQSAYGLDREVVSYVYGALVRAVIEGHLITPERLGTLIEEAKAVWG